MTTRLPKTQPPKARRSRARGTSLIESMTALGILAVGLMGQVAGLLILTLLMHPDSIFSLSPAFFDDSTGFRTRLYWAQLITIAVVTPISFVLNKLWTFSAVRVRGPARDAEDTRTGTV